MTPEQEDSPRRAHKRRKVAESCKLCRAKKTRCDGARPGCSSCTAKGAVCEYNDATVPVSATTLAGIEARLRRLEDQVNGANGDAATHRADASTRIGHSVDHGQPSHLEARVDAPDAGESSLGEEHAIPDHPTTQFIQEITQIAADAQPTAPLQSSLWGKTSSWTIETDPTAMVVPKRAVADDLLDCYETYYSSLFPILHMPTFRARYRRLWEPPGREDVDLASEAIFHATLNIVFALGCLNNSKVEPARKLRTGDGFYRRARAILPPDALDAPSLGVVQYLLLATNYLTYTRYSSRCWNVLGVAIRVAQALRLHADVEASGGQLRREMGRRVWYHCVTLERLAATIFGQQVTLVHEHTMPLPEKIDDEYLQDTGVGSQPAGVPSIVESFIVTTRIFEVIQGVVKTDYSSITSGLRLSELTEILRLNEKLDEIEDSLPPHLRQPRPSESSSRRDKIFRLQTEAVMTRILHSRLILLRPNVLAAARRALKASAPATATAATLPAAAPSDPQRSASRTEAALRAEVSALCLQTAVAAIEMLHGNLCSASRNLSSNAAFVTLSAATVIVAASLVPELEVSLEQEDKETEAEAEGGAGVGHEGGGSGGGGGGRCFYGDVVARAILVLEEHRWQFEGAAAARGQLEKFLATIIRAKRMRMTADAVAGSRVQGGDLDAFQTLPDHLSSPPGSTGEFDFSDPLWSFQWGGPAPMFDAPGFTFGA